MLKVYILSKIFNRFPSTTVRNGKSELSWEGARAVALEGAVVSSLEGTLRRHGIPQEQFSGARDPGRVTYEKCSSRKLSPLVP